MKLLRIIIKFFLLPMWLFYKPRITHQDGRRHLLPKGPLIIVSNHQNWHDFFLYEFVVYLFHNVNVVLGKVPFENHPIIAKIFGCIEAKPNELDVDFFDSCQKIIDRNGKILIFPEGHFAKDNALQRFDASVVYLSMKTGAPILPVYTDGRYGFFKRAGVNIGNPVYPRLWTMSQKFSHDEAERLSDKLRGIVDGLKKQQAQYFKLKNYRLFAPIYDHLRYTGAIINLFYPIKVYYNSEYAKKMFKPKYDALMISNHTSFLDSVVILRLFLRRRPFNFVSHVVWDKNPGITGWVLDHGRCIKVTDDPRKALRDALDVLNTNGTMMIFPEGHISRDDNLLEFKGGVSYIATHTHSPIYPIVTLNKYRRFHKTKILVGEPIYLDDYVKPDMRLNGETYSYLASLLQNRIYELREKGRKLYIKKK
ncbi:MAG: 1-acyl-sn-glycerol-3-phosphate acyltransferase [Bacilli bacterium]|nr:1-acyl-sn-glycerol-3-phosphate acyltransferase [Bacilli bacterium]